MGHPRDYDTVHEFNAESQPIDMHFFHNSNLYCLCSNHRLKKAHTQNFTQIEQRTRKI